MSDRAGSRLNHWTWQPPPDWSSITAVDLHTGGEPLRVIISGLPPLEGTTVLEKRRYFREHYDYLRTGLMWEPRGHADMYGAVVTPSLDADFDVFFMHNEGYSTMCGHAIIALTTLILETGLWAPVAGRNGESAEFKLTFNVPAGRIDARAQLDKGRARQVSFRNVASFLYLRDREIDVAGIGRVRFDVGFGGAFYAIVEGSSVGLELTPANAARLIDYGRRIKLAVMRHVTIEHPLEPSLGFLYGTIFTGPALELGHHSRNVCIFADGELDRSATGSGVSARAAVHFAKGELELGEKATIESIVGSTLTVQVLERTVFGPYDAVIPRVGGLASITGHSTYYFDPADPFRRGFLVR